jgi:hypothetical protein
MEYRDLKLVYRRYASLYFIVGIDNDEVQSLFTQFDRLRFVHPCSGDLSASQPTVANTGGGDLLTKSTFFMSLNTCVPFTERAFDLGIHPFGG